MASFDADPLDDHPRGRARSYDVLRKTQWLTPDKMRELQDEKLRRLVRHAYQHVPYYRDRMQALSLTPDDIRGQRRSDKLPLLTKDDVRKHLYFDIMSDNHDKAEMLKISTSRLDGRALRLLTSNARSWSSAGRRPCARRSGPAIASATAASGSGTRPSA